MSWAAKLVKPYRIADGKKFRLKDNDPGDTGHLHSKEHAAELLSRGIVEMADQQDKLYAQAGLSCSSFRQWTRPAKMAQSNTSCRALILRVARCIRSKRRPPRN